MLNNHRESNVGYGQPSVCKWFIVVVICMSLIACSIAQKSDPSPEKIMTSIVIASATVVDIHTGEKSINDILINNDRIVDIQAPGIIESHYKQYLNNTTVIDASGKFAIPGLWDMHVHMTFKPELLDRISALFIANGVTSVRDMGAELEVIVDFQEKLSEGESIAPDVWAAGLLFDGSPSIFDGELGSGTGIPGVRDPVMSSAIDTPEAAIELVDVLANKGAKLIKPYEMLRPEVFKAMAERASYHGLPIDGHVPLRMTIQEALDMGLNGIQHMKGFEFACASNADALQKERISILDGSKGSESGTALSMRVYKAVSPNAIAHHDKHRCSELVKLFVERDTWHTPTLSTEAFLLMSEDERVRMRELWQYLPVSIQKERERLSDLLKQNDFIEILKEGYKLKLELVNEMNQSGVKFLAGTDAPVLLLPGFSLHDELKELVKGGLSPLEALQSATLNPALFFKIERDLGSLEKGKIADIVLLDADPLDAIENTKKISAVIKRGRVLAGPYFDKHFIGE